jgi:hypothetical protein
VPKNDVGVWAFGSAVTRFVPPGYHPEAAAEPMVDKTRRVAEGLSDLLDGLEYHYPGEINEDNVEEILSVLQDHGMDLPVVAAGLHTDPTYSLGAFINPDDSLRRQGIDTLKRGVDLCGQVGASFIIWPGSEGCNYTFQRPYAQAWRASVARYRGGDRRGHRPRQRAERQGFPRAQELRACDEDPDAEHRDDALYHSKGKRPRCRYPEPTRQHGPAHGAALLTGVAAGVYGDVDEACSTVQLRDEITEPDPERTRIYEERYEVYRSLYPATREAMHRLTDLAAGPADGAG